MALVDLYNIKEDDVKEEEDPRSLNVLDTATPNYSKSIKDKIINIGIKENPKLAIIGNYWGEEIVTQIANLLIEYQDLVPNIFPKMKGFVR